MSERKGKEKKIGKEERKINKKERPITVYYNVPNGKHLAIIQTVILQTRVYSLFFNRCLVSKINK